MNKRELLNRRKENSYLVDKHRLNHNFGCVRVNSGNTLKHETAKLKMVYEALKEGHILVTECISADGKRRFDFIDFDTGKIKEAETNHKIRKAGAITVDI